MLLFTIICLALGLMARADFPLDIVEPAVRSDADSTVYRLPEDFSPIHYDVEVTPYFEDENDNKEFTFDGKVKIEVVAEKANLGSITVQENVRRIISISITDNNDVPLRLNPLNPWEEIKQYHFLKINLADDLTFVYNNTYYLTIEYVGNINETPLSRGVFRGSHVDEEGNTRWYAATHLQPTHSRQAFPSFDEPGFKSTFKITINRPTHFAESFSNMKLKESIPNGNRTKEIFEVTPRMSAYLVTFHISEDFTVIADNEDPLKPYRILARPAAIGQGEYALKVGPPLTEWLSEYFGIEYYEMEDNIKNDQIASPFWASGATENWGLVTYRELRLLYEEGQTNALDQLSIGTITAHELAHKWFGNLITCRWWDNVWINEGFASYFEYFAMDGVYPDLELADQFNLMYLQSALSTDSSANTRALEHAVNSPTEVTGHFSGISYSKGASLLLMLKHLVKEPTFKKALNYFLVEKSFEHAFPKDLFDAFKIALEEDQTISVDIYDFMKHWVEQPGFPVLNVNINMDTGFISLNQERFFISPTATQTGEVVWPLPLTYTTATSPNWDVDPEIVMTERTHQLQKNPGEEWVIFNVGQRNLYRVHYNVRNWQLLAAALSEDHTKINHLNRAQIVDDVFALMRSNRITYSLGFQVIDFLKKDTSFYSWYPAITGFNWLRNRFLHLPDVLAEFDAIIFQYLEAVIEELGYDVDIEDEKLTRTLNRFYVMSFACNIGHEGCVNDAVTKYTNLVENGVRVNPNVRRHVYCEGLRAGGLAEWEHLHGLYEISNNQADQVVMLRALGCTTNDVARQRYLNMILTPQVKHQDRLNAFSFFLIGHRSNAKVALDFLKANINAIREGVILPAWFNSVISNVASYLDEEGLQDMEQWLSENQETIPEYSVGISAINSARANMKWGDDNSQTVLAAAKGSAGIVLPTTMILMWTLLAMLLK